MPWFVLNYVPEPGRRRSALPSLLNRYVEATGDSLRLFAPTFVAVENRDGKVLKREKPLLYHYVFIHGSEEAVRKLPRAFDGLSLILDHAGSGRYLQIPDDTLEQFRTIARQYAGALPCYPLEGINLEEGDKVQIVSGPCAGLTGTYLSRKGAKSGNILVAVSQSMAVMVFDIKADYVRVLEFADGTRRPYDQMDAYLPRLLSLFREKARSDQPLDPETLAPAIVFARRMGSVTLPNPKADARLQLLLHATYRLLGDTDAAADALRRYHALEGHVTNPWMQALAHWLLDRPDQARTLLATLTLQSSLQNAIAGAIGER